MNSVLIWCCQTALRAVPPTSPLPTAYKQAITHFYPHHFVSFVLTNDKAFVFTFLNPCSSQQLYLFPHIGPGGLSSYPTLNFRNQWCSLIVKPTYESLLINAYYLFWYACRHWYSLWAGKILQIIAAGECLRRFYSHYNWHIASINIGCFSLH